MAPAAAIETARTGAGDLLIELLWLDHPMVIESTQVSLPPALPFGTLTREVLPRLYGHDPAFGQIDWERTRWFLSQLRFRPDFGKSLAQHGIADGALIRFETPGIPRRNERRTGGGER